MIEIIVAIFCGFVGGIFAYALCYLMNTMWDLSVRAAVLRKEIERFTGVKK